MNNTEITGFDMGGTKEMKPIYLNCKIIGYIACYESKIKYYLVVEV